MENLKIIENNRKNNRNLDCRHTECIYFCKWIAVGLSIAFIAAFSLEPNIELKIIIKQ